MPFKISTIFIGIDQMSAPVRRMQNSIAQMTRSANRNINSINRNIRGATSSIIRFGKQTLIAGTIAAAGLANATMAGVTFEHALVTATAKMPGQIRRGTEAFRELEDAASKVGATTQFTATDAAKGINFLAQAGFDAKQSMSALPGVVDLATVADTNLARATDIATDSLGALNLMSKDAAVQQKNLTRINDVFAKTTTRSNTSLEAMFEALKKGAPVAAAAGADLETTATLIAKMADAGIKGETAGIALKNIFLAIGAPGTEAARVFRRLGIATKDQAGNVRDVLDVFEDFKRTTAALGGANRIAVFDAIFGKIPIASAINLTNAAGKEMKAFRVTLRGAEGAASDMAAVMRDDTLGSINSLISAVEGISIRMFRMTGGPLRGIIDSLTLWVRANTDLIATNIGQFIVDTANNIETLVSTIKTVATVVAILWTLNTVLRVISGTMVFIGFLAAANPITLMVLGAVAAAGAIYLAWDPIKDLFTDIYEIIKKMNDFDGLTSKGGMFSAGNVFGENAVTNWMDTPIEDLFKNAFGTAPAAPAQAFVPGSKGGEYAPSSTGSDIGGASVVTPQERTAETFSESIEKSVTEVVLKLPEALTAEVTNKSTSSNKVTVLKTGAF